MNVLLTAATVQDDACLPTLTTRLFPAGHRKGMVVRLMRRACLGRRVSAWLDVGGHFIQELGLVDTAGRDNRDGSTMGVPSHSWSTLHQLFNWVAQPGIHTAACRLWLRCCYWRETCTTCFRYQSWSPDGYSRTAAAMPLLPAHSHTAASRAMLLPAQPRLSRSNAAVHGWWCRQTADSVLWPLDHAAPR